MRFLMDKHLFDKDYINFVYELILLYDPKAIPSFPPVTNVEIILDPSYPEPVMNVIQLGTRLLVQTFSHAFEKKNLQEYAAHLKSLFSVHIPLGIFAKLVRHVVKLLDSCEWTIYHLNVPEGPA